MNAAPTTANKSSALRTGDWFLTHSGRQFWPLDPHPADVDISDIAHALANICRFGGHCKAHYSVAQHSVLVASILPPELKLSGLLHDATEAYVGDMVRPLKHSLPEFMAVEEKVWVSIAHHFGLFPTMHKWVKIADNVALVTERRDLVTVNPHSWGAYLDELTPLPEIIVSLAPTDAEALFLRTFRDLTVFEA